MVTAPSSWVVLLGSLLAIGSWLLGGGGGGGADTVTEKSFTGVRGSFSGLVSLTTLAGEKPFGLIDVGKLDGTTQRLAKAQEDFVAVQTCNRRRVLEATGIAHRKAFDVSLRGEIVAAAVGDTHDDFRVVGLGFGGDDAWA